MLFTSSLHIHKLTVFSGLLQSCLVFECEPWMFLDLLPVNCTTIHRLYCRLYGLIVFWPLCTLLFDVVDMDRAPKAQAKLHTTSATTRVNLKSMQLEEADYIKPLDWHENFERKVREENTRCSLHRVLILLTLKLQKRPFL